MPFAAASGSSPLVSDRDRDAERMDGEGKEEGRGRERERIVLRQVAEEEWDG